MPIIKTIIAGVLAGIAIYIMPFMLLKILAIILLFKLAFRLLGFGGGYCGPYRFKNMTDEEKETWMKHYGEKCKSYQTPKV